ncbi:TolC family protein [Desulfococcus sp.]|uniref:TolC family protein n=1 Tax=Desulfococcus sp. TaxID=2025834 RepID=UPI003593FE5C
MTKPFILAMIAFFFGAVCASAAEEAVLHLEPLVREALEKNPKISSARERHLSLKEKIPQAGALEDPMLSVGVVSLPESFDFGEEDMTMKEISVSQKFPFPGKRGLSADAAAREADAGAAAAEDAANQVVREVKAAFYDLSHVYRATEVTRRNKGILEELSRITSTRYALGQGIQEDVIRNQVEISKMVDELSMLAQQKQAAAARLNFLLNRPQNGRLGRPAETEFMPGAFSIPGLQEMAAASSPVLRALKEEIAARGKGVELARREYYPDLSVRVAYGQREDRPDMYTGMVEMNLPIFHKSRQAPGLAAANADVRAARADYENVQNELFYMIADMGSMAERLERRIVLYRTGILPQARLQIDTAMSAYMVNKADFMTLLDSRMQLYRYELDYHGALTEYEKSLAALEAVVGETIPREVAK